MVMVARKAASAGGLGRVLFEEDFAANAMQSGVEPMLSGLARQRQRSVDLGQGGFRALPLGFDFGEEALIERQTEFVALTRVFRQRLSKLGRRAGVPVAELRARPGRGQRSEGRIQRKTVLSAERDARRRSAERGGERAAHRSQWTCRGPRFS